MMNIKLLYILAISALLVSSCRKESVVSGNLELTGKWQLESVMQGNKVIKKPSSRQSKYDVSLTFKEKGDLEATSANNYLTGFYETSQQNSIQLGGDGTEIKETAWGDIFVNALPNVNFYELKPTQLTLYYGHNSKLIFSRVASMDQNLTASR